MKFKSNAVVTGGKAYNDTVDGVQHNFTKIYVMTDLSEQSGFGSATVEYKWGDSENIKKIQDIPTPFNAEISMEIVTTGSRQLTIVHDVKPLPTKVAA